MKTSEFRNLVKEVIKEVMNEIGPSDDDKIPSGDDESGPYRGSGTPKIDQWRKWGQKKKELASIHDEPEFKDRLEKHRKQTFDDEPVV